MENHFNASRDLTRTVLAVVFIGALLVTCTWILRPFISAFLWATMIAISTWPVLVGLQARLGGRRGLATACLTIALLLLLLVPISLAIFAVIGNLDNIVAWVHALAKFNLPPPPDWVAHIPVRGPIVAAHWQQLSEGGPAALSAEVSPYAGRFAQWFAGQLGSVGGMVLQFLLTVIISAVLYQKGDKAAIGIRKFFRRLAGANGERAAILAANTVRGVSMGIVVTAVIQTLIAGTGLMVVSMPGAALITAGCLILCLAQVGPGLLMLPAVIWIFYSRGIVWGFVLLAFMVAAGTIDNVIRPILIRKGADLPLPLIFLGVIGGLIGFGIMGIFIGPVVLAVTFALLKEWVEPGAEHAYATSEETTPELAPVP